MKYHAFAFLYYYPGGGMEDYQGSFETTVEAKAHCEGLLKSMNADEAEIVVVKEGKLKRLWFAEKVKGKIEWEKEGK